MTEQQRWMDTGFFRAAPAAVDHETGIIRGVKVCTAGEAKGHGVHLDREFIETVTDQGNSYKRGLKARFGHPNMCSESLGTFVGRFHDFSMATTVRADGTEAECCVADLHLSETAKEAPGGDLYTYLLQLADTEDDVFGTSIVFRPGDTYRRNSNGDKVYPYDSKGRSNQEYYDLDGPDFTECERLLGCDCVDEPAANDGLFAAGSTVAGQLTEFLDLHPQIFTALADNPAIMAAIGRYGDKIDQFFTKYQQYHCQSTPTTEALSMPEQQNTTPPEGQEEQPLAPETPQQQPAEPVAAAADPVDVDGAVQAALAADRQRNTELSELGDKFGFADDARKFYRDGKSVDQFRAHILAKSPDEWRQSLAIKNPATQATEQELDAAGNGSEAVAAIKQKRQAKFGTN